MGNESTFLHNEGGFSIRQWKQWKVQRDWSCGTPRLWQPRKPCADSPFLRDSCWVPNQLPRCRQRLSWLTKKKLDNDGEACLPELKPRRPFLHQPAMQPFILFTSQMALASRLTTGLLSLLLPNHDEISIANIFSSVAASALCWTPNTARASFCPNHPGAWQRSPLHTKRNQSLMKRWLPGSKQAIMSSHDEWQKASPVPKVGQTERSSPRSWLAALCHPEPAELS